MSCPASDGLEAHLRGGSRNCHFSIDPNASGAQPVDLARGALTTKRHVIVTRRPGGGGGRG